MNAIPQFRRSAAIVLIGAALAVFTRPALAQSPPSYNERKAKAKINIEDKDGIWVLKFNFKDPRLITVDIPGRGRRLVWYLWYQVINNTKEPRTFIPDFELVTLDRNTIHHDQSFVLPKAMDAIRKLEDPTGLIDIKSSLTISNAPIPPSKPDAAPIAVTGVALWDNVDAQATRFSIFVSGLSNGWTEVDGNTPDGKPIMRRKTLQLNFKRLGDQYNQSDKEIRFVPPAEWLYRAATTNTTPGKTAPAKPGEKGKENTERKLEKIDPLTLKPVSREKSAR